MGATSSNIVVHGDFNIHVDSPSSPMTVKFLKLLDCVNMKQHVDRPTHTREHILDQVISDRAPINNLQVHDLDELRRLKTAGRALGRKHISTGLAVHKQPCRDHQKNYSKALAMARSTFNSHKICNYSKNSKWLFSTISNLLAPQSPISSVNTVEQCNKFMTFFSGKVTSIRSAIRTNSPTSVQIEFSDLARQLSNFTYTPQREMEGIINRMNSSTCSLDPLPTPLIKINLPTICPLTTAIINNSVKSGIVPAALKTALIRPHLKKSSLHKDDLANYRPISNLPFLSKILEKVVASQLHEHLQRHQVYKTFQSGFRSAHSTETALVRVINDLFVAADQGSVSLLVLLDLTAAFDTVDHDILLHRLQTKVGLTGTVFQWFQLYLTGRTDYVALERHDHHPTTLLVGSTRDPFLAQFSLLYMLPLGDIFRNFWISFHSYAEGTQLYLKTDSVSSSSTLSALSACLDATKAWMSEKFLQLNSSKTEVLLIVTPHQVKSNLKNITIL
uniref:Reverse transcriptase domain-containing protein n=1 Tax=Nothobranchius kadleci TaxID=1051664 RepID=A0A1A8CGX9_NOTKA